MSPRHGTRPNPSPATSRDKLEGLSEYERLDKAGKGHLLRREGLSTSVISAWREQRGTKIPWRPWRPCRPCRCGLGRSTRRPLENERLMAQNVRL
jgi:transposase